MFTLSSPAGCAAWRGGARRRGRARAAQLPATASSAAPPGTSRVRFAVHKRVEYGQCLRVVGDIPELGGWDVQRAPSLAWGEGDVWTGELALPPNSSPSFKFVVCTKKEAVEWEAGENRSTGGAAAVEAVFGDSVGSSSTKVVGHRPRDAGPGRSEDDDEEDGGHGVAASRVHPADSLVLALAGEKGKWQGAEVTFMRSNAHTGDRRGTWKPEGLPGAARALVEGDMCAPRRAWSRVLQVRAHVTAAC
jgi:phosphoglucan,water dikinase